ncbi:50S ribosomal protein L1 [Candidatus Saccharibacteria bacterium]|nr:50S ribosomal protein L1 [Candidatus Saccharibacteria bacterium]
MAKKAELLEQAKKLKLDVSEKNTISEIEAAIANADSPTTEEVTESDEKAPVAKAGKRSAKALKEAEEAAEKEERKEMVAKGEVDPSEAGVKKGPAPKTRQKSERRSKGYKKAAELIDTTKTYTVKEAAEILPKTSSVKFDASVELHVNLGVDPRQADQNIRATVALPHGTGKTVRIAVFAPADQHEAAKKAGADIVGEDDFLQQLDKEQIDFDVLISTPQLMAKLGKYARVLGPKGLMPNPKSGTVTAKVAEAVKEAKAGKVEFRVDKQSIIHLAVGKVSFKPEQIAENAQTVLKAIADAKPSSVKGTYIQKVTMTTTMGPSISVSTTS